MLSLPESACENLWRITSLIFYGVESACIKRGMYEIKSDPTLLHNRYLYPVEGFRFRLVTTKFKHFTIGHSVLAERKDYGREEKRRSDESGLLSRRVCGVVKRSFFFWYMYRAS